MDVRSEVKNIHNGHRKRVKANVCENGFSHLEDHKLLELFLFYSIPQADTNELAHTLLAEFGSLDELFKADIARLKRVKGVGENTAVLITTAGEIFLRASKVKAKSKRKYICSEDYKNLALSILSGERVEKSVIFCFDSAGVLKKTAELCSGDEISTGIDMRKAVQTIMDCGAVKAVIAHNHPTGIAKASAYDVDTTRQLCVMFRKLGVMLADHVIISGDNTAYSMYTDPSYTQMFF